MRHARLAMFGLLVALAGCTEGALSAEPDGDADADASGHADAGADVDPSVPDSGILSPDRDSYVPLTPSAPMDDSFAGTERENLAGCFDALDNDAARDAIESIDCDDPDCYSSVRACAVGRSDYCTVDVMRELDVLDGFTPFGAPSPRLEEGALVPNGDANYDSGWLDDAEIDLRTQRALLSAVVELPPCDGCLESVGFGFTTQTSLGDQEHVRPLVALVAHAATREVRLLVGERTVATFRDADPDGAWSLEVQANGQVHVRQNGEVRPAPASFRIDVPSAARVVVFGHNTNPGSGLPGEVVNASVRAPSLAVAACDIGRGWSARSLASTTTDGSDDRPLVGATSPSVARAGGTTYAAYERMGQVFFTSRRDERFPDVLGRVDNALMVDGSEPELAANTDTLTLYLAHGGAIQALESEPLRPPALVGFGPPEQVLSPETVFARSVASPSVIITDLLGVGRVMSVVATDDDGHSYVALLSNEDGVWSYRGYFEPDAFPELAADDIGRPELVVYGEVFHLYVPVTRGTRRYVAHATSPNLALWRLVDARSVDGEGPRERLGVDDIDLLISGSSIEAFYIAHDGVEQYLAHATRPMVSDAVLPAP